MGLLLAALLRLLGIGAGLRAEERGTVEAPGEEPVEGERGVPAHGAAGERRRFRSQCVERRGGEAREIVHREGPARRDALAESRSIDGRASQSGRGAAAEVVGPARAVEREGVQEEHRLGARGSLGAEERIPTFEPQPAIHAYLSFRPP